jgi:predicted Zn-dependent peptidase
MLKRIATLAALTVLPALAFAQDLAGVDIAYEKHVLDNGLTVLIHVDRSAPQAFVNVYYKVGSRDEVEGKTGFAHLFEHLMFNGTENYDEEYFAAIQDVGGSLNGDTWLDRTRYYQTVPNTALERVLWLESERMGHLLGAVTQEKLDQQRGVVQNEKRRAENRPYALVWQRLSAGLFPKGHPYSWTTIGSMEDLNNATLEDVHEWFRKYYGAANAILTVAGDIDPAEALELVKLHFGDIPSGPPVTIRDDWVPERKFNTYEQMQDRVANDMIARAWAVIGRDHDEVTYLQLAAMFLAGDPSSPLYKRLVKEEKLAVSVSLNVQPFDLASLATLQIVLLPGADADKARRIAEEEIARFAKSGPTKKDLALTKTLVASSIIKGLDYLSGRANLLAESEYYLGSPDGYKHEYALVDGATREDLRKAVATWLGEGYHEVYVTAFGDLKVAESGVDRSAGLPEVTSYPPAIAPEIRDLELDNGVRVRFVPREGVPAVMLNAQFLVGEFTSDAEKPGAGSIALSALTKGTRNRTADEIIEEQKRTGTSLSIRVARDRSSAMMSTLSSRIDEAAELLADVLRNPVFPKDEVLLLKKRAITGIAQSKTNPSSVAGMYIDEVLYGNHPYGAAALTADDVEALSIADLRAAYARRIRPEDLTIFAVGGIDEGTLLAALNRHIGSWKADGKESELVDVSQPVAADAAPRVIVFDMPGAPQSNIIAATVIDPPYGDGDEAFTFANTIYGGNFTSRINSNIREEKGWSYGVRSGAGMSVGPRVWRVTAQVQTDKTSESIIELMNELKAISADRPFTAEELESVRNERVRRLPGFLATASGVLGYIADNATYDRPDDFIETRKGEYEAVGLDDLPEAFNERIDADRLSWFIAGDLGKIEDELKALDLGEFEVWDVDGKRVR